MRIGLNATALVAKASVESFVKHASSAEADGFDSYWVAEHPSGGLDALTVLTIVGQSVETMELGTAVIPTYPRHPMVLAGQAVTAQSTMRGTLTLGVGLSHQPMMAELGMQDDKPIRHLRDYLSILVPLVEEGAVDYQGESLSCRANIFRPAERPPQILVAALGPQALRVAGSRTAGTSLAWVGPKTVRDHIAPTLREAAEKAGRAAPRVLATLPICVTDDAAAIRRQISASAVMYTQLPSYQAMFEREGVSEPGELGLVGSESEVEDKLANLAAAGVTDFAASEFAPSPDDRERTRGLLKRLIPVSGTL
ncbi:MAG: 5,10-methylenetetrahydromethanopterin reductase [Acidimicrobiales bacterium]|jgi:5,10-methylenetetrahydromethanopterin reductase